MKKLFYTILASAVLFGCGYDDGDLWDKVDDLDSRLKALEEKIEGMNSEIGAMSKLVAAIEVGASIADVEEIPGEGWKVTLDDGSHFIVRHGSSGQDGTNAPVIGVKLHTDGIYYWTITADGVEKWLPDSETPTLRVTGTDGSDGHTPLLAVNDEGYWTVDGIPVPDGNGGYIKAAGEDGADGDSFFAGVDTSNEDRVVFTLANGASFTLPLNNSYLTFSAETPVTYVVYGATKQITLSLKNIQYAEVLSVPDGWSATVNQAGGYVEVTAPVSGGKDEGVLTLVALDHKGNTVMAARRVSIPDYTDLEGTFLLNEGSSYSQDGTIVWYDGDMNEYRDIYQEANGGRSPGNTLQDMFIADGKAYLLCQNPTSWNGSTSDIDGQIIVCDARTMIKEKSYNNLDFGGSIGLNGRPQHLVVAGNKGFIQYVDDPYEYNSGIRVLNLDTGVLSPTDIAGTYGPFGTVGALKGRMLYSRGKIIAGLAKGVVFIDPVSETVTETISFNGAVKDIVKGADGNLYIAVTGDFTTPGGYYDEGPAGHKIYCYTQDGIFVDAFDLDGYRFTTSTAYPTIGMSASFTDPYLYFNPSIVSSSFTGMDYISRFDYSTGTLTAKYVTPQTYSYVYGYTGEHPFHKELYVPGNPNYMATRLTVYDVSAPASPEKLYDFRFNNYTASPAGIYFAYSFTDEFINK